MIEKKLARAAIEARPGPAALEIMRLSLFDWAVCAVAGRDEPVSRILLAQAVEEAGAQDATLVGSELRVPPRLAALANGTISHALDYDDTHFAHIGHPSVAVIPAALATAEKAGAPGEAMLEAALIGAEASVRIGCWLGRDHYQAGFHQTATAGAFGATVAAGRLLGLSIDEMEQALGWAAGRASGLKAQFGTMGKPMNAGIAAANGVEAALLAQKGLISGRNAMGGEQGFGPTHAGMADDTAFGGFGNSWMMETVSHKFHACCHGLHAMLEALDTALGATDLANVEKLAITSHPRWQTVCNISEPRTGLEAKFSFRQTAALWLAGHDTARLQSYSVDLVNDPDVAPLRSHVGVQFDDRIGETEAEVIVHLRDGERTCARHDLTAVIPMQKRKEKLRVKAGAIVGDETALALWDVIHDGVNLPGLTAILASRPV